MRIEIFFTDPALDGPGSGISEKLSRALGRPVQVRIVDVILPGVPVPRPTAEEAFSDPVVQRVTLDEPAAALVPGWSALVETAWKPGVTDTLALTAREALAICGGPPESESADLRTARQ